MAGTLNVATRPRKNPSLEELEAGFRARDRTEFARELARFLFARPSIPKIRSFAAKHPDRWTQALTMLAKLAGFNEEVDVTVRGSLYHVHLLSDAELKSKIDQLQLQLADASESKPIENGNTPLVVVEPVCNEPVSQRSVEVIDK